MAIHDRGAVCGLGYHEAAPVRRARAPETPGTLGPGTQGRGGPEPDRAAGGSATVSRTFLIAFCGLLLSVSAFSCDITLPAFWSMQRDLGAPIEWVQAVVPVFLIFQAIGQLAF